MQKESREIVPFYTSIVVLIVTSPIRIAQLINGHPAWQLGRFDVIHGVGHLILIHIATRTAHEMLLQTIAEIHHADHTVDNGDDNQNDGDHSECCHRLLDREIIGTLDWIVDSRQLEDEVGKTTEVEDHDAHHAPLPFSSCEPCSAEQNGNGNGDCGTRQTKFDPCHSTHDDEELNGEADEEEEIELE
jgi:hypothetical protein